jgi:hypothetical protein
MAIIAESSCGISQTLLECVCSKRCTWGVFAVPCGRTTRARLRSFDCHLFLKEVFVLTSLLRSWSFSLMMEGSWALRNNRQMRVYGKSRLGYNGLGTKTLPGKDAPARNDRGRGPGALPTQTKASLERCSPKPNGIAPRNFWIGSMFRSYEESRSIELVSDPARVSWFTYPRRTIS